MNISSPFDIKEITDQHPNGGVPPPLFHEFHESVLISVHSVLLRSKWIPKIPELVNRPRLCSEPPANLQHNLPANKGFRAIFHAYVGNSYFLYYTCILYILGMPC